MKISNGLILYDEKFENEYGAIEHITKTPEGKKYSPIIPFQIEPQRTMFFVPLKESWEIIECIKKQYEINFSKVQDRLPLKLGFVAFHKRTPMYAVLNAVNRLTSKKIKPEIFTVCDITELNSEKHCALFGGKLGNKVKKLAYPLEIKNFLFLYLIPQGIRKKKTCFILILLWKIIMDGKFLYQRKKIQTKAAAENISLPTEEIFQCERKHTLPSYINYPERVKAALRAYKLLIFKFFKHKLKNINKTKYEKYRKFCEDLTDFFVTSADFSLSRKLIKSYKQENIVLPLHLATLNWDPIFPFLFMKACKRQNEKLIKQNKLVYLSYGYPFFVKKLKGKDSGWFIFEEDSAALIDIMTYEKRKCIYP